MDRHQIGGWAAFIGVTVGFALASASCQVIRLPSDNGEGGLVFRIENATNSDADVTISSETTGGEDADATADQTTVRVGGADYSEGRVACATQVVVSAVVDENTAVIFTGDGTGTPGFDEGSIGLSGERYLIEDGHYRCGETVVIRIDDDGTGVGASTSSVGLGTVSVYASNEVPPVGTLAEDGDSADSAEGAADDQTVDVTIDNLTGSSIFVELEAGAVDEESDKSVAVSVIPMGTATGSVACAQQLTLRALIIESTSGADESSVTLYQINLSGAGTGTAGFDQDTIGPGNSRILLQGEHFECADTVLLTILDDAAGIDEEEDNVPRIGSGSVIVISAGS